MSDLLTGDIRSWLRSNARGHANAKPRRLLLAHLLYLGHALPKSDPDRAMRKAYESMEDVGSCAKGIFLVVTAEDRRIAGVQLHGHALAELVREKRVKDGAEAGEQGNLF